VKWIVACVALLCLWPARASAHGLRTAYLELDEGEDGAVVATLRTMVSDPSVEPEFPERCVLRGAPPVAADRARNFVLQCPLGLAGETIQIAGLGPVHTDAVVRLHRGAEDLGAVLTRDHDTWIVPQRRGPWTQVLADYFGLGLFHILTGFDHLLFLTALVLYVRRLRTLIWTETAFTLSHSISFSLTSLGVVSVFSPAAEACIALSLVLVALNIDRGHPEDVVRRRGPLMALVFGLVHGLGFAGALSEIGLPDHAIPGALLGFGAGVEMGQLAFLAIAVGVLEIVRRAAGRFLPSTRSAGAYAVGVTGFYWLLERLWICCDGFATLAAR
jgi:hydrogenase/urease accessory protein HupE